MKRIAAAERALDQVPTGAVTLEQAGIDSMIAFSDDDGEHWRVRGKSANDVIQADGLVISEWKPWRKHQSHDAL